MNARWRAWRAHWPWLPALALLAATALDGARLVALERGNATIERLQRREDVAVTSDAPAALLFARAYLLAQTAREDEAADQYHLASQRGSDDERARARYNLGNLHLRRAVQLAEKRDIDASRAATQLAKDSYREALRRQPDLWVAKYNLEAAQRLVRDLPSGGGGDEEGDPPPDDIWSQMPGFPNGLP
ncbi:MAG: hypothetical protein AB7I32_07295 [Gammaproteobacteria bacterium]